MASSSDITEVKQIVLEISNNPIPVSVQSDLQDKEKRWLVVGICLHSVISPVLRKFVEPVVKKLYKKLKKGHRIDTQTYPNVLLEYPQPPHPKPYKLNYESINANSQHAKKRQKTTLFDYKVKDVVDLSKLFVLPHMAHYTGFNNSCDSSALLGLLINIDTFQRPLQLAADKVRKEIRNVWAHCDLQAWDQIKFLDCFQMMTQLVKDLQLTAASEKDTLDLLTKWQLTGHQLLSGTTVGLELLREIKTEESALAKYLLHVSKSFDETDKSMLRAHDEVTKVGEKVTSIISRMEKLEKEHTDLDSCVGEIIQKHEDLEKKVYETDKDWNVLNKDVKELETKIENVESKCSTSANELANLTERVSNIEHYRSLNRPERMFFNTPARNKYFVGRNTELSHLENSMCTKETTATHFVSGLGGSGKTTFAIEFSWQMHEYFKGGLFWISAESNATFENSLSKLALDAETIGKNSQETLSRTLKWLTTLSSRWLLVVDNVDQEELNNDIKELLLGAWMRESHGNVLVTTRREPKEIEETFKADKENCIVLGPMTMSESTDFMLKRTEVNECDDHLELLVEELQGLPLAMEQAAAHIKALECSFKDYLTEFRSKRLKLSQRPISTTYTVSKERLAVRTTWQINFDYISKQSEEALLGNTVPFVMNIAAYYYGDDIPEELFNTGDPVIDIDYIKESLKSSLGVKQVTEILTRFSLFQRSGKGSFQVHRLVQEVIRDSIDEPHEKAAIIQGAIKMLNSALKKGFSQTKLSKVSVDPKV